MKHLTTVFLILMTINLHAQISDIWNSYSEEKKHESVKRNYDAIKPLFERSIKDLSMQVDTNKIFPWDDPKKPNEKDLQIILDTIANSIRYKLKDEEIDLFSRLKKDYGYNISDWYDIKILSYNLRRIDRSEIKREGNLSWNIWSNGSEVKTLNKQIQGFKDALNLEGYIDVKLGFYTDIQLKHIRPSNIGERFEMDSDRYEILDIFDNTIVVKKLAGFYDGFNVKTDFDFICTNENLKPYSYSQEYRQSYAMYTEDSYNFYLSKPTYEEFYNYFDKNIESLLSRDSKRNIIVMQFGGKIENLYFYRRINFIGIEQKILIKRVKE